MLERTVGAVFVGLVAVGTSACVLDGSEREESFTVDEQVAALSVDVGSGNISVRGTDGDTTEVVAWIHGEHCLLERGWKAGTLSLESRLAEGAGLRRRCDIDLDIVLPAGASVAIDTGSGNVELDGLAGELDVDTGSGNVEAQNVGSAVAGVHTGSGNVRARFTAPPDAISVDTGSGNIRIQVPSDRYHLETDSGSGRVNITGVISDPTALRFLDLDTGSGNLEVAGY